MKVQQKRDGLNEPAHAGGLGLHARRDRDASQWCVGQSVPNYPL